MSVVSVLPLKRSGPRLGGILLTHGRVGEKRGEYGRGGWGGAEEKDVRPRERDGSPFGVRFSRSSSFL